MAASVNPKVALVYHDDAYVEAGGNAIGLMGRQVAGRAFLESYLKHGTFTELAALIPRAAGRLIHSSRFGANMPRPGRSPGTCE